MERSYHCRVFNLQRTRFVPLFALNSSNAHGFPFKRSAFETVPRARQYTAVENAQCSKTHSVRKHTGPSPHRTSIFPLIFVYYTSDRPLPTSLSSTRTNRFISTPARPSYRIFFANPVITSGRWNGSFDVVASNPFVSVRSYSFLQYCYRSLRLGRVEKRLAVPERRS